jgi:hypothetical protein
MPAATLEAEANSHITKLTYERDEKRHRLVVRNGKLNGIFSFFSGHSAARRVNGHFVLALRHFP